jgi:hypothetical protein
MGHACCSSSRFAPNIMADRNKGMTVLLHCHDNHAAPQPDQPGQDARMRSTGAVMDPGAGIR